MSLELKFQKKNPCPSILITWFFFLGRKEKVRAIHSQSRAPDAMKGWDHFRVFSTDLQSDFFFYTIWTCCRNIASVKSKYLCLLQIFFNVKSYTSLIVCVMLLRLKRAVGNDYSFVAQIFLAFLLHHVYIIHNLCVYSFLDCCRTPTSVLSFNPRAKFIRILSIKLRLSSRFIFKGCL